MSTMNPTPLNGILIKADEFKYVYCGAKANPTPGAIMSAYMREVIAFETTHKVCTQAIRRGNASD
jgi:hypothetical protein